MPLVDDDGKELDLSVRWSFQDEQAQDRTLRLIELYRAEIQDEDGGFTTRRLISGRVLVELTEGSPLVAYLADSDGESPLVLDDMPFEIWPEWTPQDETIPVRAVRPRPLGGNV